MMTLYPVSWPFRSLLSAPSKKGLGSGEFTPASIPGLISWHDANDISTLWQDSGRTTQVTADGQTVGAWDDKSNNSNHATQATPANEPTYRTGIQNSLPVLRFDGTNDLLEAANINGGTSLSNLTIIAVYQTDDTVHTDRMYGYGANVGSDTPSVINPAPDSTIRFDNGSLAGSLSHPTAFFIRSTIKNGTTYTDYFDGSQNINNTFAGSVTTDDLYLGHCLNPCDGDLAEIVVYNSALSDANRQQLESYLATKWGITI